MKIVIAVVLALVGLINFYPAIGVLSAEQLQSLYGIDFISDDHLLLMRHRAVLFALLGGLVFYSILKPIYRLIACTMALISMLAYMLLAIFSDNLGADLQRVLIADIIATLALIAVTPMIFIAARSNHTGS